MDRLGDLGGKRSDVNHAALRTGFDFGAVFGHFDPHGWHIKHLPFFVVVREHLLQRGLAVLAAGDGMDLNVVRMFHRFQGMPRVAWLPAGGFAARHAQTLGAGLGESIAGRRFAAIAAVLGNLILQCLNAGFQSNNPLGELIDQGNHGFFALLVDRMNLFRRGQQDWCHTSSIACEGVLCNAKSVPVRLWLSRHDFSVFVSVYLCPKSRR